jgi:exodeoxyribonuclease VII large subunit
MTTPAVKLSEAVTELQSQLKYVVGEKLKEKTYKISAEVTRINPRVFGSHQYVDVNDEEGFSLQLIVPETITKQLQVEYKYEFTGYFEVSKNPKFGFFQFRVTSFSPIGKADWLLEKDRIWKEIQERGYLNRYQYEFHQLAGLSQCRIALVTSPQSQVVKDIEIVLGHRQGVHLEIVPVKLYDPISIANGIIKAASQSFEVIILARGGGQSREFEVFNTLEVVEAICTSKVPVIVALGHTENKTFADLVADKSLPTPTSAAKYLGELLVTNTYQQKGYRYRQQGRRYIHESKSTYEGKKAKGAGCLFAVVSITCILFATIWLAT